MTVDTKELIRLAKAATVDESGEWFVAGSPWLPPDVETYVLSGSPDPHAGRMVCDMPTADMAGVEDEFDEIDWRARNDTMAAYIAAANPQAIIALCEEVERGRQLRTALQVAASYDGQRFDWEHGKRLSSYTFDVARACQQYDKKDQPQ